MEEVALFQVISLLLINQVFMTPESSGSFECSGTTQRRHCVEEWKMWKQVNKRWYQPEQVAAKHAIWISNFHKITHHNLRYSLGKEFYLQGMTRFSDYTSQELRHLLLGEVSVQSFYKDMNPVQLPHHDVIEALDWRLWGWTSRLRSYVQHPHSWAFSTIGTVQSQFYNITGSHANLSVKELIDCVDRPLSRHFTYRDGFQYILHNDITLDSFYPLGSGLISRKSCDSTNWHPKVAIKSFNLLTPGDERNLEIALVLIGPISVSMKVTPNFYFYTSGGVFYDPECGKAASSVDHAVILVGFGSDPIAGKFWIVQNHWGGFYWGEEGFARIARNAFISCGIALAPMYALL